MANPTTSPAPTRPRFRLRIVCGGSPAEVREFADEAAAFREFIGLNFAAPHTATLYDRQRRRFAGRRVSRFA